MTRTTPSHRRHRARAAAGLGALAVLALLVPALPAGAHVTVTPSEAPAGGYAMLSFRVPNERDAAATTSLQLTFSFEGSDVSVRVRPLAGWDSSVATRSDGDGAVVTATWSGGRIEPGEFDVFEISAGPLPDDGELVIAAVQTYSDGEVVRWDEPRTGGSEPAHPAPVVTLVAGAGGDGHGATSDHDPDDADASDGADDPEDESDDSDVTAASTDDTGGDDEGTDPLTVVALAIGVAGLGVGGLALAGTRRRNA